ncbi:hypothetical protein O181_044242 [Austropuccinia psidii MF-1]|uniref:Uncharacterized protein n=1 Tax=Austropuccinia psidii MF-1 TaxID=1389203 RepID=A0A9Q3DRF3_9BASI|nr:hypothetical protein [Austropuccinia psidii MF-1]
MQICSGICFLSFVTSWLSFTFLTPSKAESEKTDKLWHMKPPPLPINALSHPIIVPTPDISTNQMENAPDSCKYLPLTKATWKSLDLDKYLKTFSGGTELALIVRPALKNGSFPLYLNHNVSSAI